MKYWRASPKTSFIIPNKRTAAKQAGCQSSLPRFAVILRCSTALLSVLFLHQAVVHDIAHHIFHLNHILNVPYIDLLIASGLKRTDHIRQIHGIKCQIIDKFRVHSKIVYALSLIHI